MIKFLLRQEELSDWRFFGILTTCRKGLKMKSLNKIWEASKTIKSIEWND